MKNDIAFWAAVVNSSVWGASVADHHFLISALWFLAALAFYAVELFVHRRTQ